MRPPSKVILTLPCQPLGSSACSAKIAVTFLSESECLDDIIACVAF
jgi:hypothetical protein